MNGWIDRNGEYFESPDNVLYSPNIATEIQVGTGRMIRVSRGIRKVQIKRLLNNNNTTEAEAIRLLTKGGF